MTTITDEDYVFILFVTPYQTSRDQLHSCWNEMDKAKKEAETYITSRLRNKEPHGTLRWEQQATGEWFAEAFSIDANLRIEQWRVRV